MKGNDLYKATQVAELLAADFEDHRKGIPCLYDAIKNAVHEKKDLEKSLLAYHRMKDFIEVVDKEVEDYERLSDN